jgi:hypothetical protein
MPVKSNAWPSSPNICSLYEGTPVPWARNREAVRLSYGAFTNGMVDNVKAGGSLQFKLQDRHQLLLHVCDVGFEELFSTNFLMHGAKLKGMDFLVLRGYKHGGDTNKVKI